MRNRDFAGTPVGAVGLGCMGMSWAYTESERDDDASVARMYARVTGTKLPGENK